MTRLEWAIAEHVRGEQRVAEHAYETVAGTAGKSYAPGSEQWDRWMRTALGLVATELTSVGHQVAAALLLQTRDLIPAQKERILPGPVML